MSLQYTHDATVRRLAIRKLSWFVRYMWSVIEPGTDLIWGWYHEALCEHLEAASRGEIKNLVICFPPRMLKSSIVSVMFPAWLWLTRPQLRILSGSYADRLAERDCVRSRDVMRSDRYRHLKRLAGSSWEFKADMDTKSQYVNTEMGSRIVTSPRAAATGEGGDIVMVDDPHNVIDVESPTEIEKTVLWWRTSMSTRVNPTSKLKVKIVIQQRVGDNDVAGYCIESGYAVFSVPNEYVEGADEYSTNTAIEPRDPRSKEGQLLDDRIRGHAETEALKVELGPTAYAAQMQQRPSASGGTVLRDEWFPRWTKYGDIEGTIQHPAEFDFVLASFDLNFIGKDKQEKEELLKKSFCSGIAVGFAPDQQGIYRAWLIEEDRGDWKMRQKLARVARMIEVYPNIDECIVENKAAGGPLLELMEEQFDCLEGFDPGTRSKIQRCYAIEGIVCAGLFVVPHESEHPWVKRWLEEITKFPFAKHDDRMDSLTQLLIRAKQKYDFGPKSSGLARLERMTTE